MKYWLRKTPRSCRFNKLTLSPENLHLETKQSAPQLLHVAIIMDGNGRWAQDRGLPRTIGHEKGADAVRRSVEGAIRHGIKYLTLFGFSSENWNRPQEEVRDLMKLLRIYLGQEITAVSYTHLTLPTILLV